MSTLQYCPYKRTVIKSESERLVYGEVYVPLRLDSQNDFMRREEIKKTAHRFMEHMRGGHVDAEHNNESDGTHIVESFVAKTNDPDGFIDGSWVAAGHVVSDERWDGVLKGDYNGWSVQGRSHKRTQNIKLIAVTQLKGETEQSTVPNYPPHTHSFDIHFDRKGHVIPTMSGPPVGIQKADVAVHFHHIHKTTATEIEDGHAHRYDVDWTTKSADCIKTEERIQEANELYDVEPTWLSLVEHAAIRRGFKIVKGDNHMDRVIQAIIIAKGEEIDFSTEIPELEGIDKSQLKVQKVFQLAKHDKHVLLSKSEFEEDSLFDLPSKKEGVTLKIGVLKSDNADAIVVGTKKDKQTVLQLADEIIKGNDEKSKKQEEIDMDEAKVKEMIDSAIAEHLGETFKSEVIGELKKIVKGSSSDDDGDTNTKKEDTGDAGMNAAIAALTASVDSLKEMVTKSDEKAKTLEENIKKFEESAATFPGALYGLDGDSEEEDVTKNEDGKTKEPTYKNFLFGRMNPKVAAVLARTK